MYPPLGGSGVQRTLKFTKYLPEFGWQPYVVCGDDPQAFNDGLDTSLLAEIPPEVWVWRRSYVSPFVLRQRVLKKMAMQPRKSAINLSPSLEEQPNSPAESYQEERLLQKLLRLAAKPLSPFENPPIDRALYWSLAILPGCMRLIRKEDIDLIYTSSFPYADHFAGYLIKRFTGLPWVADFRDPWSKNALSQNKGWRRSVDLWAEQKVLHNAERVINVSPTWTSDARRLAPKKDGNLFITLENGYDTVDFSNRLDVKERKTFIELTHVGRLYDGTALPFFQALDQLGAEAAQLKCRFIGGVCPEVANWLKNHKIGVSIETETRLPHSQAIERMRSTDVLLLVIGTAPLWHGVYPGKLFEYLASKTPILLIGPQGDTAELIKRTGTGCIVPGDDIDQIKAILQLLASDLDHFRQLYYNPRLDAIATFERRILTRKLANEFDKLISNVSIDSL
jgi:glycosyltransferase involved in cell wall biosynthesis